MLKKTKLIYTLSLLSLAFFIDNHSDFTLIGTNTINSTNYIRSLKINADSIFIETTVKNQLQDKTFIRKFKAEYKAIDNKILVHPKDKDIGIFQLEFFPIDYNIDNCYILVFYPSDRFNLSTTPLCNLN